MRGARSDFFVLLIVIATLALDACGTTRAYQGAERPRNEIAVIRSKSADIASVDDTMVGLFDSSVELTPGRHVVTLRVSTGLQSTVQGEVELDAKAGSTYEAQGTFTGFWPTRYWFWIVDTADRAVVAGRKTPPHK